MSDSTDSLVAVSGANDCLIEKLTGEGDLALVLAEDYCSKKTLPSAAVASYRLRVVHYS